MKRILLAMMLTGCSITPRVFDNVEYDYAVRMTIDSTRAIHRCDSPDRWQYIQALNTDSLILQEYVVRKDESDMVRRMALEVRKMTLEVLDRPLPSQQFCVLKLTNIQASSRILSKVLGNAQASMCDGGLVSRLDQFTKAYKQGQIAEDEYKELVSDMESLRLINKLGCSATELEQMHEDLELLEKVLPSVLSL